MDNNESNNSLYFIVGGLVVAALVFGFMVWGPVKIAGVNLSTLEPAAGTSTQTDQTRVEYNYDDGGKSITKTTKTQSEKQ